MAVSTYKYIGPYQIIQIGGQMVLEGRDIDIPTVLVSMGGLVDLDDDYVAWVNSRGYHRFVSASEGDGPAAVPVVTVAPDLIEEPVVEEPAAPAEPDSGESLPPE